MCDAIYRYDITVGPESIDLLGHVNNREYLRWMEEAATAHAAGLGWSFENLKAICRAWVAREHWIEYLMPAFEGERLELFTWVQNLRGAASLRRYALRRGDDLLMTGATEWVFVDYERRRPVLVTPEMRASFPRVAEDDPRLEALGIARCVRWSPAPAHRGGA